MSREYKNLTTIRCTKDQYLRLKNGETVAGHTYDKSKYNYLVEPEDLIVPTIELETASGTLTQEQYDKLVANQNAILQYTNQDAIITLRLMRNDNTKLYYVSPLKTHLSSYYCTIDKSTKAYSIVSFTALDYAAVVANPNDVATTSLTKLNVKGTVYSIPTVPTNYVTTDTTQTISGQKTFDSTDTIISGCGFSKSNNLGNSGYAAFMRAYSSNPLFGLRCNNVNYYLQATSSGLYLGPTSSVATSWAANGDMTVRGTNRPKWGTNELAIKSDIPTYYQHNILFHSVENGEPTTCSFQLINKSSTQLTTYALLKAAMEDNKKYAASGVCIELAKVDDYGDYPFITAVYKNNNTLYCRVFNLTDDGSDSDKNIETTLAWTITDDVITI